jgi:hypothetical protein
MATLDQSYNNVYMQPGAQSNNAWWDPANATTYGTASDASFLGKPGTQMGLDPDMTAAMQYLRSAMNGQNVPFTDAVKSQMLSQQSGMNAAAEGAQNQSLRSGAATGGASSNDPSLRGALRQSMAQRQGANTTAAGQINTQATLANNQVQNQSAQNLAGWGNQREGRMNKMPVGMFSGSAQGINQSGDNGSFLQMSSPTWG